MVKLHKTMQYPWVLLGEFNFVLSVDDRIWGTNVTWVETVNFATCVEECD